MDGDAEACKAEYKSFSRFDYTDIEDEIRHSVEVPEYPYAEKKQVEIYEEYDYEPAIADMVVDVETDKKEEISIVPKEVISEEDITLFVELPEDTVMEEVVCDTESEVPEIVSVEEISLEKHEAEVYSDEWKFDNNSYEAYKRMTPLEKAQICGFTRLRSYDAVGIMKLKFMDLGHTAWMSLWKRQSFSIRECEN